MKIVRILLFSTLAAALFAVSCLAQNTVSAGNVSGGGGACIATTSTLSSKCGTTAGTSASVTNGGTAVDCTAGGGSFVNQCIYNGSAWVYAGAELPVAGTPAVLPAAVTHFNEVGDSLGASGVPIPQQNYGYLTAAALGAPLSNDYSVNGTQIGAIAAQAFNITPAYATGLISIVGANDITPINGATETVAQYTSSVQAMAAWSALPTSAMNLAGTGTFTGTWTTSSQENISCRFINQVGATATYSVTGDTIYVMTPLNTGWNIYETIAVDGTTQATYAGTTAGSGGAQPMFTRIGGLTNGSHTVVITSTSNTSAHWAFIGWVAAFNHATINATSPFVLLGNTIPFTGASNTTITSMNSGLATAVATLAGDGLNVYLANTNAVMSESATPPDYADGIHPNALGNYLLASEFLNFLWSASASSNLNAQNVAALIQKDSAAPVIANPNNTPSTSTAPQVVVGALDVDATYLYVGENSAWQSIPFRPFQLPARIYLDQNFTTAANTSLQTITGSSHSLTFSAASMPTAYVSNGHCALAYSQATGNAAVAFGIQAATSAPTNIYATGSEQITVGPPATYAAGVLATLATTTATNVVSGTPGATATNYTVTLDFTLEEPATTANTVNIMVSTATSGDAVTVLRDSFCQLF
jgi:lysophospholipase L1-like esterase